MSDRFTIEVDSGRLVEVLSDAVRRLEDPRPLLEVVGSTLESNAGQRFVSKTDPAGAPWVPLLPQTLKRKKGRGSLLQSGRATGGTLLESLTHNVFPGELAVEVGFGERHARFHETGTRHMPARPLLSADFEAGLLGQQDQDDVLEDVRVYLNGLGL